MRLFLLPLMPLLLVPLVIAGMAVFAFGAFLLRMLFWAGLAFLAGLFLFRGFFGRVFRRSGFASSNRKFSEASPGGRSNQAFDDYRRSTLDRLDQEAHEFRTFLAKLKQAADAADFQAFLDSRRANRS